MIKSKIREGSVVKSNDGDLEENTRDRKSSRMKKDVVGCFQDVVGKKKILFQF